MRVRLLADGRCHMMAAQVYWHGDAAEADRLVLALEHNCTCDWDSAHVARLRPCAAHDAFVHEQRFVDGVLYGYHIAWRYLIEEFGEL